MAKTKILPSARSLTMLVCAFSALAVGACGGNGKLEHSSAGSKTTSATASASHKAKAKAKPKPSLVELVKINDRATPNNSARAGDVIQFLTKLSRSATRGPTFVHVDLAQAGPKWTITADAGGHIAVATLTSANGKPFPLIEPHFTCKLPPTPSFCPALSMAGSPNHITVQFRTTAQVPVALVARAGPLPGKHVTSAPAATAAEPPYIPTALVQAKAPGADAKSSPTATVNVSPGQEVVMRALLAGSRNGARQRVTVGFGRGPAPTLRLTVTVAGGQTSTATINSAHGKPFMLTAPTYSCYLPPVPSFCPASNLVVQLHHYALTFSASPHTPIAIAAIVQAG